jgi:hypothetical protein
MARITAIGHAVIGRSESLDPALVQRYPELRNVRLRRGGIAPRIGGWALGRASVAAITLRRWVFIGPNIPVSAALLLHELRHVQQFEESALFPLKYLWASLRYGYARNPYEADAREYAERTLRRAEAWRAGDR